mmetsp:Transcript_30586/g.60501  ORF Transcript_30586/g.60501 Transcript_30586/m.60501 type:complete len:565 (-) Transcript_30586:1001-2695(-)
MFLARRAVRHGLIGFDGEGLVPLGQLLGKELQHFGSQTVVRPVHLFDPPGLGKVIDRPHLLLQLLHNIEHREHKGRPEHLRFTRGDPPDPRGHLLEKRHPLLRLLVSRIHQRPELPQPEIPLRPPQVLREPPFVVPHERVPVERVLRPPLLLVAADHPRRPVHVRPVDPVPDGQAVGAQHVHQGDLAGAQDARVRGGGVVAVQQGRFGQAVVAEGEVAVLLAGGGALLFPGVFEVVGQRDQLVFFGEEPLVFVVDRDHREQAQQDAQHVLQLFIGRALFTEGDVRQMFVDFHEVPLGGEGGPQHLDFVQRQHHHFVAVRIVLLCGGVQQKVQEHDAAVVGVEPAEPPILRPVRTAQHGPHGRPHRQLGQEALQPLGQIPLLGKRGHKVGLRRQGPLEQLLIERPGFIFVCPHQTEPGGKLVEIAPLELREAGAGFEEGEDALRCLLDVRRVVGHVPVPRLAEGVPGDLLVLLDELVAGVVLDPAVPFGRVQQHGVVAGAPLAAAGDEDVAGGHVGSQVRFLGPGLGDDRVEDADVFEFLQKSLAVGFEEGAAPEGQNVGGGVLL